MTRAQEIAAVIMQQLGGNKFKVMTGSKDFICGEDQNGNAYLQMGLVRNKSKANRLKISLRWDDTYEMEFGRYTPYKFNLETGEERPDKYEGITTYGGVYAEDLQRIFTDQTGLYTRLF